MCRADVRLFMNAARDFASRHGYAMAFDVMVKDREATKLYESLGCKRLGTPSTGTDKARRNARPLRRTALLLQFLTGHRDDSGTKQLQVPRLASPPVRDERGARVPSEGPRRLALSSRAGSANLPPEA